MSDFPLSAHPVTRFVRALSGTLSGEQWNSITRLLSAPQAQALERALSSGDDATTVPALFALADRLRPVQRLRLFAVLEGRSRNGWRAWWS